eukprot:scaffold3033_cov86-Skeletonema_menzelii.AAC.1
MPPPSAAAAKPTQHTPHQSPSQRTAGFLASAAASAAASLKEMISPSNKNQSTGTAAATPRVSNTSNNKDDLLTTGGIDYEGGVPIVGKIETGNNGGDETSKTGGLPHITYERRKPDPLGTMFRNCVE